MNIMHGMCSIKTVLVVLGILNIRILVLGVVTVV